MQFTKYLSALAVLAAALTTGCATAAGADTADLKPFPAAKADQTRWVITLPKKEVEADWRVEIIPGKQMEVDCNQHGLSGKLHTKTAEGWGYNYYEFASNGQVMSTLMGCPPGSKRSAFVQAESLMLPYNSRLPVVVYAGKEYGVQYRLWKAAEMSAAKSD